MTRVSDALVLLRLRWLQLRRVVPQFGRVLFALGLVLTVLLLRKAVLQDATLAPYITGAMLFTVWGMHQRRPDRHFLQRHVPNAQLAMALEYGVLILPVLLGLLLAHAWAYAAAMLVVCVLAWSPVVHTAGVRGGWLRKWMPAHLFEWRSLLQSTYPWNLLLWNTSLAFCWLPVLPLFLLGAIALMACAAQVQCEPRSMLLATARDARALLRMKVVGAMRIMLVLELPVLIGATFFQPEWWWIHLLFGLGQLVLVAYAVVLKYANYRPNERLTANDANVTTAAVFTILPGLCVVPIIMLLTEVRKARENLNAYFHDHHH